MEEPYQTCHAHPVLKLWWDSPERACWVRTASVLDLGAKAIHKCSKRVTAQETALSASEKTQFSFLQMEPRSLSRFSQGEQFSELRRRPHATEQLESKYLSFSAKVCEDD